MGVGPPNHHAIIYCCEANSRRAALAPAQSRTNLGHISVSSYYTKQFSLPHHAQHIQPYPSHRWTGQTLLVESPPSPAHPAPIPWRFSGCQINTQTTQSCNSPLPVSPPPTDLHTLNLPRTARAISRHHHITLLSHSPSLLHANFIGIRQNKFGFSEDSSRGFSGVSWTS